MLSRMVFSWFRRRKRRQWAAEPFPAEWEQALRDNYAQFAWFTDEERSKLRRWVQVFVREKYWEGLDGLEVTDEMRVTVAAQIGTLMLGFEEDYLHSLRTVLVVPHVEASQRTFRQHGVVSEGPAVLHGEALLGGPVRLVWPLVLRGGRIPDDGYNVVFHETAHVLDMLDQYVDGTPPLDGGARHRDWHDVLTREHKRCSTPTGRRTRRSSSPSRPSSSSNGLTPSPPGTPSGTTCSNSSTAKTLAPACRGRIATADRVACSTYSLSK
jgi:Mlc titration factor MtfA (ptsG expression regulator)